MAGILDAIRGQLEELRLLNNLPVAMRSRVVMVFLAVSQDETLRCGSRLFTANEHRDEAGYVLLDGSVTVQKQEGDTITCSAPELLGEMQMLNPRQTRTATVIAGSDVKVLKFNWRSFFQTAECLFSPNELTDLREALANLAWEHFTG